MKFTHSEKVALQTLRENLQVGVYKAPMFADSMYLHADTCMYDKWSHAQNRNRSLYLARKSILKEANETLPLVIFSYLVNITACKSLAHFTSLRSPFACQTITDALRKACRTQTTLGLFKSYEKEIKKICSVSLMASCKLMRIDVSQALVIQGVREGKWGLGAGYVGPAFLNLEKVAPTENLRGLAGCKGNYEPSFCVKYFRLFRHDCIHV